MTELEKLKADHAAAEAAWIAARAAHAAALDAYYNAHAAARATLAAQEKEQDA